VVIGRKLIMGKETVLFKSEEKKSSSDIANTLRQIADKIDDGTMILKQGSEEITLEFPKNMGLFAYPSKTVPVCLNYLILKHFTQFIFKH
jgi:amphi-Trp domain-containing protein